MKELTQELWRLGPSHLKTVSAIGHSIVQVSALWCRRGQGMPEISRFLGIVVAIFYGDHPPPHFHARYGEHRAITDIETLQVLSGWLPPRVLGLVIEWGALHKQELRENWRRGRRHAPLEPISPLE